MSIVFPDGTTKLISPNGTENITFPDKTNVIVQKNGSRVVKMPRDMTYSSSRHQQQGKHRILIK